MGISHFTFLSVTLVSRELWRRDKVIYCDGWQRNGKEAGLWEEEKCVCSFDRCGRCLCYLLKHIKRSGSQDHIYSICKCLNMMHTYYLLCNLTVTHLLLLTAHPPSAAYLICLYLLHYLGITHCWSRWKLDKCMSNISLALAFQLAALKNK